MILTKVVAGLSNAATSLKKTGFWRLKRAKSWLVELGSRPWLLLTQITKKHALFTAVIRKDADHTRTFHCSHGALRQDHQRSAGRLNHHVCDLVATRAIVI